MKSDPRTDLDATTRLEPVRVDSSQLRPGPRFRVVRWIALAVIAALLAAAGAMVFSSRRQAPAPTAAAPAEVRLPSAAPAKPDTTPTPATVPSPSVPPTLAITPHVRNDLAKFDPFTYSSATTLGLTEEAGAIADKAIANIVTKAVAAGESANTSQCTEGSPPCGQFIQTIAVEPCVDGYLCVLENVGMTLIGSMITEAYAATLAISTTTGEPAQLSDFVPDADLESFVKDVNDQVATVLISEGVYDEQMPPDLKPRDITAWLPHPDGIQLWFPKYLAGPGALGVVTVLVPYPGTDNSIDQTVQPSAEVTVAPEPESQASSAPAVPPTYNPTGEQVEWAGDYLCYATPSELPRLRDASADESSTEMLQVILILLGYSPGPMDGAYGPVTMRAVTAFQQDHALTVDGLVGPQTWGALKSAYC